jgi:hypothetical protein
MVRVGSVHYNTVEEVKRFGEALGRISENVLIRRFRCSDVSGEAPLSAGFLV